MSPRGKGRWLLWIGGMGAIAALVAVGVSWKDILTRYHLERLHRDPTSLPSFLDAPDGTSRRMAVRAFAREPRGREVVVSLFVDYFEKARATPMRASTISFGPAPLVDPGGSEGLPGTLGDVDRAIVGFHGWAEAPGRLMFWGELRWECASQNGWFVFRDGDVLVSREGRVVFVESTRIVAIAELLVECRGASIELPRYPGLRVEVLSLESGLDEARRWTKPLKPLRGSWAPVDDVKPAQSSVLLLSRISKAVR